MNRKVTMAALGFVLSVSPVLAGSPQPYKLISIYMDLNEICRGNSGDEKSTLDARDVRTKVSHLLNDDGWCLGKKGQGGAQMTWHECTKNSYRAGD
jgi:hypothetical protein